MPAYTRFQKNAIARAVPVARVAEFHDDHPQATTKSRTRYNNSGERWTQQEERDMIRMLRHENASVVDVAKALHRNPLAIHYRIDKVLVEHVGEDDVSVLEAGKWLHPHISARQMSEDFNAHIATFKA